nr:hypothetical protein [Tanacetum cinerariifolium]
MLLAKKNKDEQVLLVGDQAWMESSSDSDQKINANMVSYYIFESESESEYATSEYYDNTTTYGLFVNDNDDQENFHDCENFPENLIESQINHNESAVDHNDSEGDLQVKDDVLKNQATTFEMNNKELNERLKVLIKNNDDLHAQTNVLKDQLQVKHVVIDTHVECQEKYAKLKAKRYEYMIRYSAYFDNDKQHRKQIADQEVLYDKMSVELVELDKPVEILKTRFSKKTLKFPNWKNVCTVHMITPSKDNMYNGRKGIGFKNPNYFCKAKDLRPTLYDERVINLGYISMFLTHSNERLEIKKFKRSRENKIEFAYDYGSLNASYVKEKINFSYDYFQEIINPDFDKIDSPFQQTSSLKPYVPTVILEKIIIDLEDEVVSLLEKQKENLKTSESLKSNDVEIGVQSSEKVVSKIENKSENDCQEIEKVCDRKENPNVIAPGMFKLNVSQSVSPISVSKTSCDSKNVENKTKRKRHKRTSSKQNDKQVNNGVLRTNRYFVHFLDLDNFSSVRRPKQSSVIWKKKWSSNTSHVDLSSVSHLKLNKVVKRYSRKDLLSCNNSHLEETSSAYVCNDAMNVSCNSRLCDSFDENNLFIFDDESVRISPVSKMPFRKKPRDSMNVRSKGNSNKSLPRTVHRLLPKRQPLAEPVAKWIPKIVQICLWIIDSGCSKHMTGNRDLLTNFVEKFLGTVRFGNNDFAVIAGYGDVGLKVAFRKSTCFVRNEDGVDLLTGDRSSNLYTIDLNEVVSNYSACLLAKASSSQSWLWHQRLSHLNFATVNNVVKNNLVQGLPKMKFEKDHLCSACEQGKIHRKHHKTQQQNGVVERRNRTLVEAARTMLTFANLPLFHWTEAIATACFTQNRLIIHKRFDKTPYELMNKRKPNIKFFRVFRCRCYLLNDYEDVGKHKEKRDIGVFVGYEKECVASEFTINDLVRFTRP